MHRAIDLVEDRAVECLVEFPREVGSGREYGAEVVQLKNTRPRSMLVVEYKVSPAIARQPQRTVVREGSVHE